MFQFQIALTLPHKCFLINKKERTYDSLALVDQMSEGSPSSMRDLVLIQSLSFSAQIVLAPRVNKLERQMHAQDAQISQPVRQLLVVQIQI